VFRLLPVLIGLPLLVPASVSAAPFGEPSLLGVGDTSGCLRATGAPGELARSIGTGVQFLQASPHGLTVGRSVETDDDSRSCPRVAAKPGGAGVLAYGQEGDEISELMPIRAHLREPGGDWGPAVEALRPEEGALALPPAVAVSERGDAIVAATFLKSVSSVRLSVTRREPGGTFGAPQELARVTIRDFFSVITAQAGMSASGEAIVAWAVRRGGTTQLWAAVAAPGAPFGTPRRVADRLGGARFDLAVGADGRALLAFVADGSPAVVERAPGEAFAAPQALSEPADVFAFDGAVALRPDGGAVVAWTEFYGGPVVAAVRDRPGAFGALALVPGTAPSLFDLFDPLLEGAFRYYISNFGLDIVDDVVGSTGLNAAITGDGRALLTWGTVLADPDDVGAASRSATLALSGGLGETRTHGANLRGSGSLTPVVLSGGGAAVAWTDAQRGRVHLAMEGATDGVDPEAPRVRVGRPVRTTLPEGQPLVLPFTCSAACDVRAEIASSRAVGVESLSRAGRGRLVVEPLVRPIGQLGGGPVRVVLRSGAPGARRAVERAVTFNLRRKRVAPVRVLGLTARRSGNSVVVRWRTNRPVEGVDFTVLGLATRDDRALPVTVGDPGSDGTKQRRFSVRLRKATDARWVVVLTDQDGIASQIRRTTVRVRR
jgi:hypothetical protein